MRRTTFPIIALLAVVFATGCGGDSDSAPEPPTESLKPATVKELSGRIFTSTSVEGRELVPDTQITLEFANDTMGVRAGCNSTSGKYRLKGGRLTFSPGPSTLMGCPEELIEQDKWLNSFLQNGAKAATGTGSLTLTGEDEVTIELEESAALPSS